MAKVLCFIGMGWAFGTVHSELVRYLHARGVTCDLLDWSKGYSRDEFRLLNEYYDYIYGIPGETWPLVENYGVPLEKIIVVAHGDYDLHRALETRPHDEFDKFAGFGVISPYLQQVSAALGIRRIPKIVKYGVNCRRFFAPIPRSLDNVGYGGKLFRDDNGGVDWKRGALAQKAVEAAGLTFSPAGSFHYLAMPQYYRSVDALVVPSSREGFGLPALEAAASGRLVISTPVGGFLDQAACGAGIVAPLDPDAFVDFVTDALLRFKSDPAGFAETCRDIRAAAHLLDWDFVLDDWIELFTRPDGR